jgi:tRNA nucleotidyltransferase (CCA-adding enzyme)
MGQPNSDQDWVVVGATSQELISLGFTPVGKDFPVFLHPASGQEYALARTERKSAPGYHGFVFHADPSVTLEEDLARRDLTINAIAKDKDGTLIDPHGGAKDIKNKIFRHVSPAFQEDPVRILRLARFAARFPDFNVAPETQSLLEHMCKSGELDSLVAERVWQEISKGLSERSPFKMFEVLLGCGALQKIFPNLKTLAFDDQIFNDLRRSLDHCARLKTSLAVRFAVVNYYWPISDCVKAPKDYLELAQLVTKVHSLVIDSQKLSPAKLLDLLHKCDALRRPDRFHEILKASHCIDSVQPEPVPTELSVDPTLPIKNLPGLKTIPFLTGVLQAAQSIDHKNIAQQAIHEGLVHTQIGQAIDQARVQAIHLWLGAR